MSFWVRGAAKRKCPALTSLREELCRRLREILALSPGETLDVTAVRDSLGLLRLFTALRGIAGMKFSEEEIKLLLSLITKRPPPSRLGVRLAATGLCILISCNSLLSQPPQERQVTPWVRWLVSWSEAPREMLLLAAIHFHARQLSAVAELVCQTLGIRQEIPVTAELSSSSITGYLPVHCIQQLLSQPTIEKAVFAVDLISTLRQGETGSAGAQPAGHREDSQGIFDKYSCLTCYKDSGYVSGVRSLIREIT